VKPALARPSNIDCLPCPLPGSLTLIPCAVFLLLIAPLRVNGENASKTTSSPLDHLDASKIADSVRMEKQPKEIVAIIAEKPGATFASVSADSKTLAVAHPSGTIRGWDLTGKEPKLIFALK